MSFQHGSLFVLLSLAAGVPLTARADDPAAAATCATPPGMPGPAFQVAQSQDGTYVATFTGTLTTFDAGRSKVTIEGGGRTLTFGAYGAILDLSGFQQGDRVTLAFDASYSDHTHEPLWIRKATEPCPMGLAEQGFVITEGRVGDFDLGFAGKVKEVTADRVVVKGDGHEVTLATLEGYVVPGSVQKGLKVTAYFHPVRSANRVYLMVDEAGNAHRPGVPRRQDESQGWGW